MTKQIVSKLDRKHLLITRTKRWPIGNFKMISEKMNEDRTNKEDDDFWSGSGYFDGFRQVNSSLCG
jgi:hypothetical protein